MKKLKICLAASSGGHLEQILYLSKLGLEKEVFLVTEKTKYDLCTSIEKVYYVNQVNRKEKGVYKYLLQNARISRKILKEEKPDVIITTGVLAIIPLCLIGKLKGIKLIYIESFAKRNSGTLTGKLLYKFADLFIVQWEEMLNVYPKAVYAGSIY